MSSEARQIKDSAPKKEWTPLELAEMKTGKYLGPNFATEGLCE